jgi:hypothetical protein
MIDNSLAEMWSERISSSLAADLERETNTLSLLERRIESVDELPFRVLADYHKTRVKAFAQFESNPLEYADAALFPTHALPKLHPVTLFVRPQGATHPPPEDTLPVYEDHYSLPFHEGTKTVDVWWAYRAVPTRIGMPADLRFEDTEAWIDYLKYHLSVTRLLLDGRRQPRICGPDIDIAETILTDTFGFRLRFVPRYEYPDVLIDPSLFRVVFGEGGKECDLTPGRMLDPESAAFVSPILVHRNEFNRRYFEQRSPALSQRWDWSMWVIHKDILPDLKGCHVRRQWAS